MSARDGLKRLRSAAPQLQADYDHVFEPAGGGLMPLDAALASAGGVGGGPVVGMIDGGVASHPSLAGASIEQNGFSGSPQPTGHGTAIASLLVGSQGPFRGAAVGASLYVADVYGGNRAAGSATAIVKALGWLAGHRAQVINISLVGPPNKLVERAVQLVQRRGIQLVAAVGNDGPAAPPQYPASYAGVMAVTAVDGRGRALPEAGKADASRLCRARRGHGRGAPRQRLYQGARNQLRRAARRRAPAAGRLRRAAGCRSSPGPGPRRPRNCLRRLPYRTESRRREINLAGLYG